MFCSIMDILVMEGTDEVTEFATKRDLEVLRECILYFEECNWGILHIYDYDKSNFK